MARAVPVIDLSPYQTGEDKMNVARAVGDACEKVGFLVITGHGVPERTIEAALNSAKAFFKQPFDVKANVKPTDPGAYRGYQGVETKSLAKSLGVDAPADLRESFTMNRVGDKRDPYFRNPAAGKIFADNVWPSSDVAPAFEKAFTDYYLAMDALSLTLMRIFALALGLPEHFFDDKVDKHFTNCAAYHYPPMTAPPKPGQLRGGAHTDFGSLTLVYASPSPKGLQVWNGSDWEDVPSIPGTFVVNIGDLMAQWTNDRWVSTLHRVVIPPESEWNKSRYSLTFFHQPNYDVLIESLDNESPAKYAPVTSGEHLLRKLSAMRVKAQSKPQ